MNSRDEIMSRLLNLFPKHVITAHFEEKEAKKNILVADIVEHTDDSGILEFACKNSDFTKQHVYVLTHDFATLDALPEHILTDNTIKIASSDAVEYCDLYDVSYRVFLLEPNEEVNLAFKWPIRILVNRSLITVHFTILEKNIQSYFGERRVLTTRRLIDEKEIVSLITNQMNMYGTVDACDLNRGVKELWDRNFIDALEVQYLKAKSTSKETMHEEYTFKQIYPELYEQAMLAPLVRALFKFITDTSNYCDHFAIEPSSGKLTFPTYPKKKEHTQNVIRKILEFN